jgi:hypothetical protein
MSVVAAHSILLYDINILAKYSRRMDWIIGKSLATELHHNTMNRKDGFFVRSWKPEGTQGLSKYKS